MLDYIVMQMRKINREKGYCDSKLTTLISAFLSDLTPIH